jgi:hypothetical protein
VWFDAYPSGIARIVRGVEGSDLRFAIDVLSNGRVRAVDSVNTQIVVTPVAITRAGWVRIEWRVDHGSGAIEIRLYNDPSSTTPTTTATSASGRSIGARVTAVQFGRSGHQQTVGAFWTDEPAVSDMTYPGPA